MDAKALIQEGDQLFGKRGSFMSYLQDVADNFYVERADFTVIRTLGDSFADHLTSSYPTLVRRDLGNSITAMSRPTATEWFHMRAAREEYEDQPALEWLEAKTNVMRRAMYDRRSQFTRATKEGDHDFAAFGQCVISVELNKNADGLLYRCWHLRDVAWCENSEGIVSTVHRKWKPTAQSLVQIFGDRCHQRVKDCVFGAKKEPYKEIQVRHVVKPGSECGYDRFPFVSVYIDVENDHIIEEKPQAYFMYVIPRWQTVSGSQYSYSPATTIALPDARLLQAMTSVLLEAGEKAVNPPLIATQEALRSDIAIYAGGITMVDAVYDERTGDPVRLLTNDKSGIPLGIDMHRDTMQMLREAFFLNTLTLPQNGPEMTAYEVGQRIQEYIRQASPIFEPMEQEYNGALCETTFDLLMRNGAFGPADEIPQSIRGKDIQFRFESPLHDAIERQKGQKFMEVRGLLAEAVALDPSLANEVDVREAFRDALDGIGAPAKWRRSEAEIEDMNAEDEEVQEAMGLLETMGAGAEVAKTIGEAGQALGPEAMAA